MTGLSGLMLEDYVKNQVLKALDNLVMKFVTSVSISVLVNGTFFDFFQAYRRNTTRRPNHPIYVSCVY